MMLLFCCWNDMMTSINRNAVCVGSLRLKYDYCLGPSFVFSLSLCVLFFLLLWQSLLLVKFLR